MERPWIRRILLNRRTRHPASTYFVQESFLRVDGHVTQSGIWPNYGRSGMGVDYALGGDNKMQYKQIIKGNECIQGRRVRPDATTSLHVSRSGQETMREFTSRPAEMGEAILPSLVHYFRTAILVPGTADRV
ncbi:hypothetical protein R1flu_006101 [Riccia fluitans]|uniref:Uncharacterized protein n=1 Tax=Riccia fluitans TaxID=41844 RepID=A0ABD1YV32_9MARC